MEFCQASQNIFSFVKCPFMIYGQIYWGSIKLCLPYMFEFLSITFIIMLLLSLL